MTATVPFTKKPFASSILLWMRTDQSRQQGMEYWKGPHSKIISATPGFDEYRQVHLAASNPGLWPATHGVQTAIPADRRIDGVAEVTFQSTLSPLLGRRQTRLAYQDEINVFRRTLLYAGPPNSTRWYDVGGPGETGARALIYLRRREGVGTRSFRKHVTDELVTALASTGMLTELRTQVFMPWNETLWNTPNVAHDNPTDQRLHASLMLGFADASARAAFFGSDEVMMLSDELSMFASAVHAYEVSETLTYVSEGDVLPHYAHN
ncbi:strictosidine synthase [Agromyces neolithicus]|uniref:Strictosidine synthase n=1 Tax=Agromyces neolithicus TaxID=269420 RepID=A0ABN2M0R2_9MICO